MIGVQHQQRRGASVASSDVEEPCHQRILRSDNLPGPHGILVGRARQAGAPLGACIELALHFGRARVLVGEPCVGNSKMNMPIAKPDGSLHNSMVDRLQNPSIFVLSSGADDHGYPEFMFTFKRPG